ncbi:MAG: hypothetical protein ACRCU3_01830 [Eubacteriaceae bacterium]
MKPTEMFINKKMDLLYVILKKSGIVSFELLNNPIKNLTNVKVKLLDDPDYPFAIVDVEEGTLQKFSKGNAEKIKKGISIINNNVLTSSESTKQSEFSKERRDIVLNFEPLAKEWEMDNLNYLLQLIANNEKSFLIPNERLNLDQRAYPDIIRVLIKSKIIKSGDPQIEGIWCEL